MANIELNKINELRKRIKGEVLTDSTSLVLYSTDASAYSEKPLGVVYPRDAEDIGEIINFCNNHKIPIIPRAAGTSLAGQVVGNGLVVDISKHLNII